MGICDSTNEGRVIRLTKRTMYQFNDNKLKKQSIPENSKSFKEFKIKEINCGNFYNINNNYNYSISNNNNEPTDESINGLKLMNQPIQNIYEKNITNNEIYQKLLTYFNSKISEYHFNNLSQQQIILLEKEFTENKVINPYKFIENKNYGNLFNKIYALCFLKCEPLLNNINDNDKKSVNLLFFRTIIILLRENTLDKTLEDIINSFIELTYENNYIDIDKFYNKIKSFCEICYQILFYFFIAANQFTEEQYYEYLSKPDILVKDKYSNVDIDIFCLNIIFDDDKGNYKLEEIVTQWADFICGNINYDDMESDNFNKNNINFSNIKNKIGQMINPYHLFEVLSGLKLPNS